MQRYAHRWSTQSGELTSAFPERSTGCVGLARAYTSGGIWGASRHALTVGFLAGMIFAIGPRILPAFCGAGRLFSPRLMLAACLALNAGCLLRVASEIPAYEGFAQAAWRVLPWSAILELTAVGFFAVNMALTLRNRYLAVAAQNVIRCI